jgi:predicted peptidase
MQQQECTFESYGLRLRYLLALPQDYGTSVDARSPLILFLHGRGECGDDLALVKRHGLAKVVEAADDFPFIVVSPQCAIDVRWSAYNDTLIALLDELTATFAVDPRHIYLTGLSLGGRGTWELAYRHPERFAAIAPICGHIPDVPGFLENIGVLKEMPVWVFHGAQDTRVPITNSEQMVAALRACGSAVRFTVYPEARHDSWTETYNNPELYEWLMQYESAVPARPPPKA